VWKCESIFSKHSPHPIYPPAGTLPSRLSFILYIFA
jgi:hypothetical protein